MGNGREGGREGKGMVKIRLGKGKEGMENGLEKGMEGEGND